MYDAALRALRHEIETGGARSLAIDGCVETLLVEGAARVILDLLASPSDTVEDDEGMFTLVHAAKAADDTAYVAAK